MRNNTQLIIALLISGAAAAAPTIATDFKYVNTGIWDAPNGSPYSSTVWYHDNPFEGDYETALEEGCIDWVSLTVKACDINPTDQVVIKFYDAQGTAQTASLQNGVNVFMLEPEWVDSSNKVKVKIDYDRSECFDRWDDAYIKWSTLKVAGSCPVVPAPGALVLGSIGTLAVAGLRTAGNKKKQQQ